MNDRTERAMSAYAGTLPRITDRTRVIDPAAITARVLIDDIATRMLTDDLKADAAAAPESGLTYADFIAESPRVTGKPATGGLDDHRELGNWMRSLTNTATEIAAATGNRDVNALAARMQPLAHQVDALVEHVDQRDPVDLALELERAKRAASGWRVMAFYAAVAAATAAHFAPAILSGVAL